jgi:hypothetical protein
MSEEVAQTESQDLSADAVNQDGQVDESQQLQQEAAPEKKYLPEDYLDSVYKVTIDGEEKEMTVREIARLQSLEQASQNRFRKAAEANRKVEEFVEFAKKDPESALRRLGYDPEEFSTSFLKKKIEEMQMSPEQLKERQEREKFQEEKKQFESQMETRIREEIDVEMTQAFQQSGLPKSPFLAARMAGLVAQSMEQSKNGQGKPLSYQEAAVKVKSWFQNATKETLSQMDAKAILDFLGPDMAKKLQSAFVQRIEGGTVPTANSQGSAKAVPENKPKHTKKFNNWRDYQAYVDSL